MALAARNGMLERIKHTQTAPAGCDSRRAATGKTGADAREIDAATREDKS